MLTWGRRVLHLLRRRRRRRIGDGGLRTLGVLVLVLIGALAVAGVDARMTQLRRSAETPATIVDQRFQVGGGTKEQQPRGFHLRYTYVVDGRTFDGGAFRSWSDVSGSMPKVCFDRERPDDHILVRGDEPCGSD